MDDQKERGEASEMFGLDDNINERGGGWLFKGLPGKLCKALPQNTAL